MLSESKRQGLAAANCEIRLDDLSRQLYASDASIYQITPVGVAFPKSAAQAASAIKQAVDAGTTIVPRGAATGLAGGAVGDGLVIDFARYNRQITELNVEAETVRVGAGVVLDQLNAYLQPHGFWFGPDVATSSRATLGGMIANNSSGAHTPAYGTTSDHLNSVDVVLADGTITTVGKGIDALPEHTRLANDLVERYDAQISERMPEGMLNKRWPGYGFDDYRRTKGDLAQLIGGSEGTLAGIMSAEIRLSRLPKKKGLGLFFFASVMEAMEATVEFLDLNPVAIEHIDRILFDETKGQLAFRAARSLMRLDEEPCEAMLIVEFWDDCEEKLAELEKRNVGLRKLICRDEAEQALVWSVRKAGLSLLTACKGPSKPVPGIEDVCVEPHKLPEYVKGLMGILRPLGCEGSYYGHAASGLLHVRPKLNLHTEEGVRNYRKVMGEVSALCKQFQGAYAAEHGVGISRTEHLADHLGEDLMKASHELKNAFDPKGVMNPGKLFPDPEYKMDTHLRQGAGHEIKLPFEPKLGYVERDESFVGNLEQCNGCGGCRKDAWTMCPTYIVTGEEIMSTRGRTNTIRAVLEGRLGGDNPLASDDLAMALDNCLSCKACKTECPSNVDVAQLKADLKWAKHQKKGIPLVDRMIANADLLGRLNAGPWAPISNFMISLPPTRWAMKVALGFTTKRPMPPYTTQPFPKWFKKRANGKPGTRGKVVLFDDTWVRYNEPNIGQAAVKVLEAAGYEVELSTGRKCCGRPAMSRGVIGEVERLGKHNVAFFNGQNSDAPIIFLEPSCYSMFVDDYLNLRIPGAEKVAERCVTFEEFMFNLLGKERDAVPFKKSGLKVAVHGHCHAKALTDVNIMPLLVRMLPDADVKMLDTGCCGMAGAFGMMDSKYELSKQVAQPLVDQVNALEQGTKLVASGTSCRHQIEHLTTAHPLHMAELMAQAL